MPLELVLHMYFQWWYWWWSNVTLGPAWRIMEWIRFMLVCNFVSKDNSNCVKIIEKAPCMTDRKTPCKFPFKYLGKTYKSCTKDGGMKTFWCATEVNSL